MLTNEGEICVMRQIEDKACDKMYIDKFIDLNSIVVKKTDK